MALFEIDVLGFIAKLRHETKLFEWVALLFQLGASMLGSFLILGGITLTSAAFKYGPAMAWPLGIGSGMVSAAITLAVFLRRSPLVKGMMFVFPAEESAAELKTDIQVLSK